METAGQSLLQELFTAISPHVVPAPAIIPQPHSLPTFIIAVIFLTVSFNRLPVQLLISLLSLSLVFLSHETFLVKTNVKLPLKHMSSMQ